MEGMSKEIYDFQLNQLKDGKISIVDIDNPSEEMKWIEVNKNSFGIMHIDLTTEMIRKSVELANPYLIRIENLDTSCITEANILKGIEKIENFSYLNNFIEFVTKKCKVTKNIAFALAKKCSLYYTKYKDMLQDNTLKKEIVKNHLQADFDKYSKTNYNLNWILPYDLELDDDDWNFIINNNFNLETYVKERITYIPQFIRDKYICKYIKNINDLENLTKEDFITWLKEYSNKNFESWQLDRMCELFSKKEFIEAFKQTDGTFIQYLKKPCAELCIAAIEINPFNIQYIKTPSDKMRVLAVTLNKNCVDVLDKKTKAVCKALGEEWNEETKKKANPYPDKYYLCSFKEDLADEGYLIKVMIVKGSKMEKFMNTYTSISFGNLDDDEERLVKDIVSYKPITESEISTLKKFGLNNLESGYWSNLDDIY